MRTVESYKSNPPKPSESTAQTPQGNAGVQTLLQTVVDGTYGLLLLTQNYHFNVEGPHFRSLHLMFEEQYTELFQAVDQAAERLRALGADVEPFGAEDVLKSSKLAEAALRMSGQARADRMVADLIACHRDAISVCMSTRKAAEEADDLETQDMVIGRITAHQKTIWMLNSILK